ncbi:MAG: hypothetical protein ABF264_04940 [Flavobacteriales bacterium]
MELEVLNKTLDTTLNQDMYLKLIEQIQKDFVMSGIQYDFLDLSPQELMNSLYEIMEELLSKEYATLLNLLYRMDIPESSIRNQETDDVQQYLVELIVKREFLKVKMRMKYS